MNDRQRRPPPADDGESVALPTSWLGVDETPIYAANHFLSQFLGETFFVTFGVMTPPVLLGTVEEKREQAMSLPFVPIKTVGRVALTRKGMEELIGVLQQNLQNAGEKTGPETG